MKMNIDQAKGMLVGLAVGDALGTTLEFTRPSQNDKLHTEMIGRGPFNLPAGAFTDDSSLALAMASSLIDTEEFDPIDVIQEFWKWYQDGKYSTENRCFDIGNTTRDGLNDWSSNFDKPYAGSVDNKASGNGGIMRIAPIIIWNRHNYEDAMVDAVRSSMLTHASEKCIRYAQAMASVLWHGSLDESCIYKPELQMPEHFASNGNPFSGGYVAETYSAACHAVKTTSSFEDAIVQAVNYRFDADTTGAVAGQIAGSIYGMSGIPQRWLDTLLWREKIEDMAVQLWEMASTKGSDWSN